MDDKGSPVDVHPINGFSHIIFLGLEILKEPDGLIITQQKYTLELLSEYDCSHLPLVSSPFDPHS